METITRKESWSYAFAGFGQNMIYAYQMSFLLLFYTSVFGIPSWIAGLMFMIAKTWDAFNDILMGTIVDNTKTRFGKLRPYLLIAPLPIMILSVLIFTAFDASLTIKIIYMYVTYILWGMVYTLGDVPYWGLSAAMSPDSLARTKLISFTRIMTMIGTGLVIIGAPLIIEAFGKNDRAQGYLLTSVIISMVGGILFFLAFFNTKERSSIDADKITLKDNIKLLKMNKPLIIIMIASLLGFTRFSAQVAGPYFAEYNLLNLELFSILGAVLILSMIVAMFMTPFLTAKFGKKNVFIATSLFGAITYFIMYFIGYDVFILFVVMLFITSLSMGFFNVLQTSMIADSIDYLEHKTGKRAEGICFAGQTFFFKVTGALTSFMLGVMLSLSGYVENMLPTDANASTLNMIFLFVTIFPGIGCLLSIFPMLKYNFTEDAQRACVLEINARKEGLNG
ncbi:MAG: MFS transporter [Candidatus Izemoplasmataceae bacterium]